MLSELPMTKTETQTETQLPPSPTFRRALPWWMQVTVLLVVFVAGGVAGSMITTRVIHSRLEQYRQQAPIFSEDIVMRLRFRLQLSDEQAEKVRTIIENRHSKMIRYRNEGSQKMHAEFDTMVEEVAGVLDDLQAERWRGIADHVKQTYLPAATATVAN